MPPRVDSAPREVGRRDWIGPAFALFVVGVGTNQYTPLLSIYREQHGLGEAAVTGIFSVYVLGLIPMLFVAGRISDRNGRRAVMIPVLAASLLSTFVMIAGVAGPFWLVLGRLLTGVATGAVFGAGSAWVRELSVHDPPGTGARRAAIALSGGFGFGALVAGLIGAFAPYPMITPYLFHVLITIIAIPMVLRAPDVYVPNPDPGRTPLVPRRAFRRRFALGVAPWAWLVFGVAGLVFTTLPRIVAQDLGDYPSAIAGVSAGVALAAGILIQPAARRLADSGKPWRVPASGLLAAAISYLCGAGLTLVADVPGALLLMFGVAVLIGVAYGTILVGGLVEVEMQAGPYDLAGMVAMFYVLAYLGFAVPYLLTLLADFGGLALWLLVLAAVALALVPLVRRELQ